MALTTSDCVPLGAHCNASGLAAPSGTCDPVSHADTGAALKR